MELVILILAVLLLSFKFKNLLESKLKMILCTVLLLYLLLVCNGIKFYELKVVKETVIINCLFVVLLLNGKFFVKNKIGKISYFFKFKGGVFYE